MNAKIELKILLAAVLFASSSILAGCGDESLESALARASEVRAKMDAEDRQVMSDPEGERVRASWAVLRSQLLRSPNPTRFLVTLSPSELESVDWIVKALNSTLQLDDVASKILIAAAKDPSSGVDFIGADPLATATWMRHAMFEILSDASERHFRRMNAARMIRLSIAVGYRESLTPAEVAIFSKVAEDNKNPEPAMMSARVLVELGVWPRQKGVAIIQSLAASRRDPKLEELAATIIDQLGKQKPPTAEVK